MADNTSFAGYQTLRLYPDQLNSHLKMTLAPLYFVFGEEQLLVLESINAIRAAAKNQGYEERERLDVEASFDWSILHRRTISRSLFSRKCLLELRVGNFKLGNAGANALINYAARLPEDILMLITAGRLEWSIQRSHWFKALDKAGVVISANPIDPRLLPSWIEHRLIEHGLNPTIEAVELLVGRVEGNLLAAIQEIERLVLLVDSNNLTSESILSAVCDSSRYSIYDWVDAALLGQPKRVTRILTWLQNSSVEPVLANWVLYHTARLLVRLAFSADYDEKFETKLTDQNFLEKRKSLIRIALHRLSLSECRYLLSACAQIDRTIKGIDAGSPWDMLLENSLRLAGLKLLFNQV